MNKEQLLDPLSTICRLILLNFKPPLTKISIHNHALILQEPEMNQSIIRYLYGDSRSDISSLYFVFIRFIHWYIINNENSYIKKLTKYVCSALKILQNTYKFDNAVLTLQYYINLLQFSINNIFNDDLLPNCIEDKENELCNLLDYDKIKNLWTALKIKDICELYDKCFETINSDDSYKQNKINSYLLAIDDLILLNEIEFRSLVHSNCNG